MPTFPAEIHLSGVRISLCWHRSHCSKQLLLQQLLRQRYQVLCLLLPSHQDLLLRLRHRPRQQHLLLRLRHRRLLHLHLLVR